MFNLCQTVSNHSKTFIYSESVAVETPEVKGEVIALKEEISPEPHDGAEPEPQQREEETEKQEEDIEKQEQEKQEREEEQQEDEKQKEQANVAEEKEGAENTETQKAEILFSSEKVEVRLIPVTSEGSVDKVHKLDEYESPFHTDVPTFFNRLKCCISCCLHNS